MSKTKPVGEDFGGREPRHARDSYAGLCPMRSVGSLAVRPMEPLWASLPAIEQFLAPLKRTGLVSDGHARIEKAVPEPHKKRARGAGGKFIHPATGGRS